MVSLFWLIIAIVFAASVTYIIYNLFYSYKINKKINNAESVAHINMPSLDMIGKLVSIFAAIAIVTVILFQLEIIRNDISHINEEQGASISQLSMEVNSLREELAAQNTNIKNFAYECIGVNSTNNTTRVKFICELRTYSETTNVKLVLSDQEIVLKNEGNGAFSAETEMNLFEVRDEKTSIIIETNGTTTVEEPDMIVYGCFAYEALPQLGYIDYEEFNYKNDGYEIKGAVMPDADLEQYKDYELYISVNGEKVQNLNLDINNTSFETSIKCAAEDTVRIVLEGTDQYGYKHKKVLAGVNLPYSDEYGEYESSFEYIYDSNGNELFSPKNIYGEDIFEDD